MTEKHPKNRKPDPQRVAILRSLPQSVKEQITGAEAEAFMYDKDLPETLLAKLQDYLIEDVSEGESHISPPAEHTASKEDPNDK